ncbi:MAG: hypothetical protein LBP96_05620 [Bacteroidales bacterium]|jgi:hypothetical protein|nr:hypothetical protein [Bacteroidales bacterium]
MKTKTLTTLLLGIVASLCLGTQCEKEPPVMPPETQTGENTFGCYVDNLLYVVTPARTFGSPAPPSMPLSVSYSRNSGLLRFTTQAVGFGSSELGYGASMDLLLNNPKEGEYNLLTGAYFSATRSDKDWRFMADTNCGQVFITKFDTVNRIVSGTFEFTVRKALGFGYGTNPGVTIDEESSTKVRATSGRFDIQLQMYDN